MQDPAFVIPSPSEAATSAPAGGGAYGLLLVAFAMLGAIAGVWQVVLADLARALALGAGPLGIVLMLGSLASIPVMVFGGRLVDARGARPAIAAGAAAIAACFLGHGVAGSATALTAALLLYGAGVGLYDVGINAAAARFELLSGRRVMAYLHAAFSGGAMSGALLSGLFLALGVGFRWHYLGCALGVAAVGWAVSRSDVLPGPGGAARSAGVLPRSSMYRQLPVMLLAFIAAAGYFGESTMEAWSAIYLRQSLGVAALVGASGVAVFHLAMLIGRLATGAVLARVGRRPWLLVSSLVGIAGIAVATTSPWASVAIAGMLLVGFALSAIAPLSFSLAAEAAPEATGQASAAITTIAYFGSLVAPGVIGWVADATSLRLALGLVAVACLQIFILSWWVAPAPNNTRVLLTEE